MITQGCISQICFYFRVEEGWLRFCDKKKFKSSWFLLYKLLLCHFCRLLWQEILLLISDSQPTEESFFTGVTDTLRLIALTRSCLQIFQPIYILNRIIIVDSRHSCIFNQASNLTQPRTMWVQLFNMHEKDSFKPSSAEGKTIFIESHLKSP